MYMSIFSIAEISIQFLPPDLYIALKMFSWCHILQSGSFIVSFNAPKLPQQYTRADNITVIFSCWDDNVLFMTTFNRYLM